MAGTETEAKLWLARLGTPVAEKVRDLLKEIGVETADKVEGEARECKAEAKEVENEDWKTEKEKRKFKKQKAGKFRYKGKDVGKNPEASKPAVQAGRSSVMGGAAAKPGTTAVSTTITKKDADPKKVWMFGIFIIVLAVLVALLFNVRGHSANEGRYREDFEAKVAKLQHQFPNQNHVLWNALKRLGSEHIVESSSEPSRPLVFVLVSTPDNSEELNCFSESVATAFLNKGDYGVLDGSNIVRRSQSKPDVDKDIERRLTSSSTYPVLLVKDLGSLPYDIASLFVKYCDNEDAPYPQAIFIFTLTIDGNNSVLSSSTRKEITSKCYEYLTTVAWKDAEKAKTDDLIAIIFNPYPLSVMKEDSSMLKEVC